MKILNLSTNQLNQNGYHRTTLTLEKIGFIYTAPIKIVPDDCLACDGYVLKKVDYQNLYTVIGTAFNTGEEAEDEFRIPDYNITNRYLQPSQIAGVLVEASLPKHTHSATTSSNGAHTHTAQSAGAHTHTYNQGNKSEGLSATGNYASGDDYTNTVWKTLATGSSGAHTHTTSSNGAHTHTLTTGNASSGIYNSNGSVLPASQTVHLCIKYK